METVYYNFDLAIEENDGEYVTVLVAAPDGAGSEPFLPPLSDRDLDRLWSTVERRTEIDPSTQRQTARAIGTQLYAALFAGELAQRFQENLRRAYQARAGLNVRLDLSLAPELGYLPWEFLFDPTRNEFLTLSIHSPFIRHLDLMHRIEAIPVQPPLRVLVVVAEPDTYSSFGGERKWLDLVDSLDYLARDRRLLLERLRKPSLLDLQRRLRQNDYHVLHFVGHGMDNPLTDDGQLVFEDEIGRGRAVSGLHLGSLLARPLFPTPDRPPRLRRLHRRHPPQSVCADCPEHGLASGTGGCRRAPSLAAGRDDRVLPQPLCRSGQLPPHRRRRHRGPQCTLPHDRRN